MAETYDWTPPTRRICNNILEAIGNTPMVRLNNLTKSLPCTVLAKVETFNPGNSTKDRMALKMLEDAEEKGLIPQGGTIIEGTSGNTGMGLAMAAVIKGYKCIFTSTDKQSKEKFDLLRAFGAEVIVCPTNVEPEDPRSYYSVSSRLVSETPNSWKANQYDNLANSQAHFESTGPEIWYQTSGKITHLVVGVGTGGTISGCARYLKQKNPSIQILGIDTYGSALKKYKETGVVDRSEIYPYITEGIGEDFIPKNVAFDYIDHFEKVTDKDACLMTREIARQEGILVGNSAGSAICGLLQMKDRFKEGDVVVVIFHDHGSRYIGKMFNDEWLIGQGWLEPPTRNGKVAKDLIKKDQKLITVTFDETVEHAYQIISQHGVCQVPVVDRKGAIVGALQDTQLYTRLIDDPSVRQKAVENVMSRPFPTVDPNAALETISRLINKDNNAVMVRDEKTGGLHIITKYDIINAMG